MIGSTTILSKGEIRVNKRHIFRSYIFKKWHSWYRHASSWDCVESSI